MEYDTAKTDTAFSVAMCTCNGERFLESQLESILAQTMQPCELVICDDASEDGTRGIIERFSASFPVRVELNEKRLGTAKNFEKAIALCRGDYIALADQDDIWAGPKLETMAELFGELPEAGIMFSDAEVVGPELEPLGYRLWDSVGFGEAQRRMFREGGAFEVLSKRNVVTGATMAMRASLRDAVLPIPAGWMHDGWIALIACVVSGIACIEHPLIKYRQHGGSQIGSRNLGAGERIEEARRKGGRYFEDEARRLDAARERITALGRSAEFEDVIELLEARGSHLQVRARIARRGLSRIPAIAGELLALRYHRYSNGLRSIISDLFTRD
jgi:glycosyltransferase involved in cell wall biosynthesis